MRKVLGFLTLALLCFGVWYSIGSPSPGKSVEDKPFFALHLVGYISTAASGFSASDGCGRTTTTEVYSYTRPFGEINIGDTLRDVGGTAIPAISGHGFGFATQNGVPATKGFKMAADFAGQVKDISICASPGNEVIYKVNSSGANCAQTSFPINVYGDITTQELWNGKILYDGNLGDLLNNGTYTATPVFNGVPYGTAVYTFTVSGGNGQVTSLAYCSTNPLVNAGPDQVVTLPSPTINLTSTAFDPDGSISTIQWTQQSGPNTATIVSNGTANTGITDVIAGIYIFRMTATDNSSNTGYDEVQITVQPPPLCATPTLFDMQPRMVWDLSGASGQASQRMMDTLGTQKFPSMLGAGFVAFDRGDGADPKNGDFDFDHVTGGIQGDKTTPMLSRASIHPGNTYGGQTVPSYFHLGNGNQRVIFVDFEKVMYWDQLWWIDSTGSDILNAAEIIITNDVSEVRNAVFQFRTGVAPTIDYVLDASSISGFKSKLNMRDTGQYMIIRFNAVNNSPAQGANFKSFFPYGCPSPFNTFSTQITPNYNTVVGVEIPRDTTQPVPFHQGRVIATAIPGYPHFMRDTFPYSGNVRRGGYLLAVDTAAANGGLSDTSLVSWNIANANIKWYQSMYGDINLFRDTSHRVDGCLEEYMVVGHPSRRLLKQVYNLSSGVRSNQHIPIDSFGCDIRLQSSYGRFTYNFIMTKAVLGFTQPSGASPYIAYLTESRIAANPFVGRGLAWGRKEWIIPYNENNFDFRPGNTPTTAGSSWMPPVAFWAFHDTLYNVFKATFPSDKFVMQGLAAEDMESFFESEQLGRIWYMDKTHRICDIINIHNIVVDIINDIDKGCAGNIGQHSVFPGQRNETAKMQAFLDAAAITSGVWRNCFVTEYTVGSSKSFQLPVTGCDFNVLSVIPLKGYHPYEVQGILRLHQRIAFERVMGIYRSWQYEAFDSADSTSIFYNNNDASQGDHNPFNHVYKAGHFIDQQHSKWLANYRVWRTDADTANGTLIVLYRNIINRDSFCTLVMNQAYVNRSSAITILLATDVTTAQKKVHSWPDWTYNGITTTVSPSVGLLSVTPDPEGQYFLYQSPGLAALLDNTPTGPNPGMKAKLNAGKGILQ